MARCALRLSGHRENEDPKVEHRFGAGFSWPRMK
jgi:hypothetical protein